MFCFHKIVKGKYVTLQGRLFEEGKRSTSKSPLLPRMCVENYMKILKLFKIQTKIKVDKCIAVNLNYNQVYIPQYENTVCLGTNRISRLCFGLRVEVWYFGDSLAISFSR